MRLTAIRPPGNSMVHQLKEYASTSVLNAVFQIDRPFSFCGLLLFLSFFEAEVLFYLVLLFPLSSS
jgi:hypothetical protein